MEKLKRKIYKIDAAGEAVGRVATQATTILRGKNKASYMPNLDLGEYVEIINVSGLKITGKKNEQKEYFHHSGYPGGLKSKKMRDIDITEALRRAIWNMLPKNKLRNEMIKRLTMKK